MAKVKTPKKKAAKKAPKCSVTFRVDDREYTASGDTFEDALRAFSKSPHQPNGAKTRVLVTFSMGDKAGMQTWLPVKARRMFNMIATKGWSLEVIAKDLLRTLA